MIEGKNLSSLKIIEGKNISPLKIRGEGGVMREKAQGRGHSAESLGREYRILNTEFRI
jgi:hypothetical protein